MVADFEQGALETGLGEHGVFDGRFGISFEHDGGSAVGHVEYERVVVGGCGAGLVSGEGREDGDLGRTEGKGFACVKVIDADMEAGGFIEQCVIRAVAGIIAYP